MGAANYEPAGLRGSMLCLGIFVDTGGKDTYPPTVPAAGNGKCWTHPLPRGAPPGTPVYGVGLDE
jgi:hypothetical protein